MSLRSHVLLQLTIRQLNNFDIICLLGTYTHKSTVLDCEDVHNSQQLSSRLTFLTNS